MKKLYSIFTLSCLLMMLFIGQAMAAKPQAVLVDNFDDGNNWLPLSSEGLNTVVSTPQFIDNRLVITLPADAASPYSNYCPFSSGVRSVFQLQGDFDVQVDYELLTDTGSHTGVYAGLCVPRGNISRASLGDEEYFSQFDRFTYGWVVTSDTKGTLRMTRTTKNGQPVIQGWFLLASGKWHPLLSYGGDNSDIKFDLSAWSFNPGFIHQDVSIAFDNFIVNSGTVLPSASPTEAFVSGKGWINSPVGACVANDALSGKADFTFNARFAEGNPQPDGQLSFDFAPADLAFTSSSFESIQFNGSEVTLSGTGVINGQGSFDFTLTAFDGQNNGLDTFRLNISDKNTGAVVYDTLASLPLGNGHIAIHHK